MQRTVASRSNDTVQRRKFKKRVKRAHLIKIWHPYLLNLNPSYRVRRRIRWQGLLSLTCALCRHSYVVITNFWKDGDTPLRPLQTEAYRGRVHF